MKDSHGVRLRLKENAILTALRRFIPGDFQELSQVSCPALEALGIDLTMASICPVTPRARIGQMFLSETLGEKQEPVATFIKNKGDWNLVFDTEGATAADHIWLFTVVDFPDRFLQPFVQQRGGPGLMLRPMQSGWLVALPLLSLKYFIKNASRGNYEL